MLRLERVAVAGLGFVLIVVFASAAIRLGAEGSAVAVLRATHRGAATGVTLAVLLLAWLAWRSGRARAPVALAFVVTLGLSLIGIAGGKSPPLAVSMGNILGGLVLAATMAWLAGARRAHQPVLAAVLLLQCGLGAWVSLSWRDAPGVLLAAHALLGVVVAVSAVRFALSASSARVRAALILLALAVPAAGIAAAFLDRAFIPALAHALVAVLLVASLVLLQSRSA